MKPALLEGVQRIIDAELRVAVGKYGYKTKTTADNLNKERPPQIDLTRLVNDIWRQIVVNWVEGGCGCAGACNWRWKLNPEIDAENKSPEVILQRKLMALAKADPIAGKRWSNETPTASGLSGSGSGEPGHLDLAYAENDERVKMVELKVGSNHPVYAGIQLVVYALMLVLARSAKEQVKIATDPRWLNFKKADLRVLAPIEWYDNYHRLGWFEQELDDAVKTFGDTHDLAMTFRFRCFDQNAALSEQEIVARLGDAGRVAWKSDTSIT